MSNDPRDKIFCVALPNGAVYSKRCTLRQARRDRKESPQGTRIMCAGMTVCPGCGQPVEGRVNDCNCGD